MFLRKPKQWLKWSSRQNPIKGNETRIQNPQSCSWLVVWQNQSGSKDSNQRCRHQTPTRRHLNQREISHVMSGTIFTICSTSAISASFAALRICPPAALKRWRKGCKKRKEKRGLWQSQSRRWTWSRMLRQVPRLCKVQLHRKVRKDSGHPVNLLGGVQGDLHRENKFKTQRRVRKCGWKTGQEYEETRSGREEPGTSEFSWKSKEYEETRRTLKLWHRRYWQSMATQSPHFCSYWARLFRDFTFHQESAMIIETVLPCNWEVDHGSERNYKYSSDRSAAAYLAKDNLACWQGSSVWDCKNQCLFWVSVVCGDESVQTPSKHGRRRLIVLWIHVNLENWIVPTVNRYSSSGQFPRIHYVGDPRWDSKVDDWNKMWTEAIPRKNYLHASVQRHLMETKRGPRNLYREFFFVVSEYVGKFAQWHWSFLGPGSEKKRCGTQVYEPDGEWDGIAGIMMLNFSESGHPVFPRIQCLWKRRIEEQKTKKILSVCLMAATKPSR